MVTTQGKFTPAYPSNFEVNLETEELRHKSLPVRLPAQSFQVLRLLLSRPAS